VKIISGFGGNNAAIYCRLCHDTQTPPPLPHYAVEHRVLITPHSAVVDGTPYETQATGNAMLTQLYKRYIGAYPRYYKMDRLSQLGFVAAEMLLSRSQPQQPGSNSRAIMLFNHTASAWADTEYAKTIDTSQGYYPSPALFLYTLPNMVCGEIAIRHAYKAETDFYIVEHKELATMQRLIQAAFLDSSLQSMVAGWVDYQDENNFEADVKLIIKT
jgi:3-oxoacyl-[acyl-carrier-protein] synthase-1